ncbi:hypothetical protein EMCG_00647 [[Emmonsia] crescens]|uniref:Uncharacterized protein n=1 Tax=[Emmonsia] crescens TaxID=73230 RepID=A0A0G2HSM5_9EURO|nr:hypothetical protein EMCG_00647 [Emmonsia crescens UAMH 3008]
MGAKTKCIKWLSSQSLLQRFSPLGRYKSSCLSIAQIRHTRTQSDSLEKMDMQHLITDKQPRKPWKRASTQVMRDAEQPNRRADIEARSNPGSSTC